jgi:hypothetical protein
VLLALGGAGPDAAAGMVIQLLANGSLQQIVQPVAYGPPSDSIHSQSWC